MKKIIATCWDTRNLNEDKLCRGILQHRNTPSRKDGLSPAQKLFGRPVQNTLPAHRRSFAPEWQRSTQEAEQQATHTLQQSETFYNAHNLPDIQIGSTVALQNPQTKLWDIYGTIIDIGPHRRYYIKTHSGRVLVRNHRFLCHRTPATLHSPHTAVRCPNTAQFPSSPRPLQENQLPHTTSPTPAHQEPSNHIRRSERPHKPTRRLIEDTSWH